MEVGVLPKPGMWEYHRMKNPAKHDSNPAAVPDAKPKGNLFDLSALDSDDEE